MTNTDPLAGLLAKLEKHLTTYPGLEDAAHTIAKERAMLTEARDVLVAELLDDAPEFTDVELAKEPRAGWSEQVARAAMPAVPVRVLTGADLPYVALRAQIVRLPTGEHRVLFTGDTVTPARPSPRPARRFPGDVMSAPHDEPQL